MLFLVDKLIAIKLKQYSSEKISVRTEIFQNLRCWTVLPRDLVDDFNSIDADHGRGRDPSTLLWILPRRVPCQGDERDSRSHSCACLPICLSNPLLLGIFQRKPFSNTCSWTVWLFSRRRPLQFVQNSLTSTLIQGCRKIYFLFIHQRLLQK